MTSATHKKLGDMKKKDIVGDYQTTTMTHFDGNVRKLFYTDIETPFPEGAGKIVSVTDTEGIITNANSTFVAMSGYTKDELIGAPHYILHHPDMPKAAFKDLWDSLAASGQWEGYVKNLRKDGGFYWVWATVFSLKRNGKLVGYTSSRSTASLAKIQEYTGVYKQMLAAEQG